MKGIIYYHFQLDTSSKAKQGKINKLKAGELERILKNKGFEVFDFNKGINGASNSLLVGRFLSFNQEDISYINSVITGLDLPYHYKGFYSKK